MFMNIFTVVYATTGRETSMMIHMIRLTISGSSTPMIPVKAIIREHRLHTISDIDHALVGFTLFISLHRIFNGFFEVQSAFVD